MALSVVAQGVTSRAIFCWARTLGMTRASVLSRIVASATPTIPQQLLLGRIPSLI